MNEMVAPAGCGPGDPVQVIGPGGAPFVVVVPPDVPPGGTFSFAMPTHLPALQREGRFADPTSCLWYYIRAGVGESWQGPMEVSRLRSEAGSCHGVIVCREDDFDTTLSEPLAPADAHIGLCEDLLVAATAQAVHNLCTRLPGTSAVQAQAALVSSDFHAGRAFRMLRDQQLVQAEPVDVPVIAVPVFEHPGAAPVVVAAYTVVEVMSLPAGESVEFSA